MNYYPFHVGDYAAHTAHLEPMEDLAYRRLLDQYYLREGALPADIQATAKLVRMRSFIADVESVLNEFFTLTDAGWVHKRCDAEIERMQDKQQKQREKANKRWHKPEADSGNAVAQGNDAAASKKDADALPPTPTPTPTPITITSPIGDGAPKPVLDANDSTADNCPHQQIIALYHEHLPTAIRVREWTPARAQALRARWREKPQRQNLDWWERFFGYIAESDFLMGRSSTVGRKPFEIDLEWICQSKNFVKIIEGKFHEAKEVAA